MSLIPYSRRWVSTALSLLHYVCNALKYANERDKRRPWRVKSIAHRCRDLIADGPPSDSSTWNFLSYDAQHALFRTGICQIRSTYVQHAFRPKCITSKTRYVHHGLIMFVCRSVRYRYCTVKFTSKNEIYDGIFQFEVSVWYGHNL